MIAPPAVLNLPFSGGCRWVTMTSGQVTSGIGGGALAAAMPGPGPWSVTSINALVNTVYSFATLAPGARGRQMRLIASSFEVEPTEMVVPDGGGVALTGILARITSEVVVIYAIPEGSAFVSTFTENLVRHVAMIVKGRASHDILLPPDTVGLACQVISSGAASSLVATAWPDGTTNLGHASVNLTVQLDA